MRSPRMSTGEIFDACLRGCVAVWVIYVLEGTGILQVPNACGWQNLQWLKDGHGNKNENTHHHLETTDRL